jgi:hypothetical protein
MEEVVFFHRKTRTFILADYIENFEADKVGFFYAWLMRLGGVVDPDGKSPPKSGCRSWAARRRPAPPWRR